jgi:hypothetical protein
MKTAKEICKERLDIEKRKLWDLLYDPPFAHIPPISYGLKAWGKAEIDRYRSIALITHRVLQVNHIFDLFIKHEEMLIEKGFKIKKTLKNVTYDERHEVTTTKRKWWGSEYTITKSIYVPTTVQSETYLVTACCGEDE